MRICRAALPMTALLAALGLTTFQPVLSETLKPPTEPVVAPERLREGETVDLVGQLTLSGDRAIFHPQDRDQPLRVLENLALERITQVLAETQGERLWAVSGVITEYRGSNYILISRAVLKAQREKPVRSDSRPREE